MAGAGTYSGNNKLGSLGQYVRDDSSRPRRQRHARSARNLQVHDDLLQLARRQRHHHDHVRAADVGSDDDSRRMPQNSAELKVNAQAGCPSNDELCGFKEGMQVMIFDDTGASDIFSITNVQDVSAPPAAQGPGSVRRRTRRNTYITQIAAATYWLKTDTVAETYQLMRYDGYQTDAPIAENIVGLAFEYFADPSPPVLAEVGDRPDRPLDELRSEAARRRRQRVVGQLGRR